jgi:MYXO-CTERM domain-containing protein
MRSQTRAVLVAFPLLLVSGTASAHFTILQPPPASTTKDGKGDPPCGPTMDSGVVTAVQGGHEIDLVVDETINHPGFYRVALALNDLSELPVDNTVYDKGGKVLPPAGPGTSDHADYQMTPMFPVLADNLFPHQMGQPTKYMGKVMLPNVNCDKCTLQVIEFMAQHGSNGPKAGYFYHNCANLKITADPALPLFDPKGGGGGGTGGSGGAAAGSAGAAGSALGGGGAGGVGGGAGGAGGVVGTSGGVGGAPVTVTAGSPSAGSPTTAAGGPSVGGPTTTPNNSATADDGGCGVAHGSGGAASLLSALSLALALGRRRRRAQ